MNASPLPTAPGADGHPSIALIDTFYTTPGDNSIEILDGPIATTQWLTENDLVPKGTQLQDYCHVKLTTLRTALRSLFDSHLNQTSPDIEALRQINAAIRTAPQTLTLEHHPGKGFILAVGHPVTQLVEHAMARIAEDAIGLLTGEESGAIEECGAPSCNRVFLRTHARRHWCSNRCGDRVRAARAYAKRKQAATA